MPIREISQASCFQKNALIFYAIHWRKICYHCPTCTYFRHMIFWCLYVHRAIVSLNHIPVKISDNVHTLEQLLDSLEKLMSDFTSKSPLITIIVSTLIVLIIYAFIHVDTGIGVVFSVNIIILSSCQSIMIWWLYLQENYMSVICEWMWKLVY